MKNWGFLDGGKVGYVISDDGRILHKGPARRNDLTTALEFHTQFKQSMTIHGAVDRTDSRVIDALIAHQMRDGSNGPYPIGNPYQRF